MTKAAFLTHPSTFTQVYGNGRREEIERRTSAVSELIVPETLEDQMHLLRDVEVIFSAWGMPCFTQDQLDRMPNLRAVFYAAGSVQLFARPLIERGITVVSAWRANAIPVAEYTCAQIVLASKGYFRNIREYDRTPNAVRNAYRGPGNYGETIALLGAGSIGRTLITLLKPYHLSVIVFDPYLDQADADALGVEKVGLTEAFARGYVVSNHLADKPEIAGMIDGRLLCELREGATFINTGRGRTVNHDDLLELLRRRKDLTALLDVTHPEPLPADSPFFDLPNALLSTHIAGSIGDEVLRMADYCIEEFDRFVAKEPLQHEVTLEMLNTMA